MGQSLAQLQGFLPLEHVPLPHALVQTTQSHAGAWHVPLPASASCGSAESPGQHCGGLGLPVRLMEPPSPMQAPASMVGTAASWPMPASVAVRGTQLPAQGAVEQMQPGEVPD